MRCKTLLLIRNRRDNVQQFKVVLLIAMGIQLIEECYSSSAGAGQKSLIQIELGHKVEIDLFGELPEIYVSRHI